MKKISLLFLGLLFIFFVSSGNLNAWDEGVILSLNWGVVTDDDFSFDPFMWTAGFTVDFHFAEILMFSPEFYIIVPEFDFDESSLAPAVLLNVKADSFFVGAGVSKWFYVSEDNGSSDFLLKLNAGFRDDGIRFVFFLVTSFEDLFEENTVGATFGFEF